MKTEPNKWTAAIAKLNERLEAVEGNTAAENKIRAMIAEFERQGGANTTPYVAPLASEVSEEFAGPTGVIRGGLYGKPRTRALAILRAV